MRKSLGIVLGLLLWSGGAFAQRIVNPPIDNGDITVGAIINGTCPDGQVVYSNSGVIGCKAASTGTVTSVGESFTGGLISVAGSPVTTSGTLALTVAGTSGGIPYFSSSSTWASTGGLPANALLMGGATSGPSALGSLGTTTTILHGNAAGPPSFSAVSLTADVTGTLPIANGGTGQTTASAAFNALSPMTTAGDIIYGGTAGAGTRLAAGTTSQVLIGGTTPSWGAVALASMVSGTLPIANGGTGQTTANAAFNALSPMTTAGDIIYGGASGAGTRLAAGTSSQTLLGGSTPSWGSYDAGNLAGTTLAAGVVTSSLTTVGTLGSLTVSGTTTSVNVTASAQVTALKIQGTGGAVTLSSCGTGPSTTGTATKLVGVIVEGTSATGCIVTFASAYTAAPMCTVVFSSGIQATTSWTTSTTALTVTNTSSGTFTYHCFGA